MADRKEHSDLLQLLQHYREGKLSEKEAHALEKRMLNDPFLREAYEGLETLATETAGKDLEELAHSISERATRSGINQWNRRWRVWAAAASVLLVVTAGTYLLFNYLDQEEPRRLGQKKEKLRTPQTQPSASEYEQDGEIEAPVAKVPTDESVAGTPKAAQSTVEAKPAAPPSPEESEGQHQEIIEEMADEAEVEEYYDQGYGANGNVPVLAEVKKSRELMADDRQLLKEIRGKVVSSKNLKPLGGAMIWVQDGVLVGTQTDPLGQFQLEVVQDHKAITLTYEGYYPKITNADEASRHSIALEPRDVSAFQTTQPAPSGTAKQKRSESLPTVADTLAYIPATPAIGQDSLIQALQVLFTGEKLHTLKIELDEQGNVVRVQPVNALPNPCLGKAKSFLKELRWLPSRRGGIAIPDQVTLDIYCN